LHRCGILKRLQSLETPIVSWRAGQRRYRIQTQRFDGRDKVGERTPMRQPGIQSPTVRRYVREEIQRRILSGESRPGERVAQQSLAKELGVGQGSVREALVELQFLGLVDTVDRLGVFVGNIDAARLCEAYEVREFLEGLAARRACGHASQADVNELKSIANEILELSNQDKVEEMGAADRAFHLRIVSLSGNEILIRLAEGYRVLGMAVRASRDPRTVHEEHLQIVEAIQKNLPDKAEKLARRHVEEARRVIAEQAATSGFVPKWVLNPRE
ncbi:MAG: GntR family transcriptional regulator, partial [Terriglobales bacterium]